MSRKTLSLLAALAVAAAVPAAWSAEPPASERAARILEDHTSFHWGRDCLVWIVHYPEELVEPWVDADSSSRGLSPAERDEYLRSFRSQLRMGEAEPFLLTVYHFGLKPLVLSPLTDHMTMKTGNGVAVPPISYERKLDQPISGIVQGLVFFPKQEAGFSLTLKGLGIYPEQLFAFDLFSGQKAAEAPAEEVKSRVVKLPPVEPPEPLTPLPEPAEREPLPPPVLTDTEPPAWLGPGPDLELPEADFDLSPPLTDGLSPDLSRRPERNLLDDLDSSPGFSPDPGQSRDGVLKEFLDLWAKGDTGGMFSMLDSSSRAQGTEAFAARANNSPLRWCLSGGYSIRWLSGNRAKVSVAQKLVIIRVLQSEVLEVVQEDGRLAIVW